MPSDCSRARQAKTMLSIAASFLALSAAAVTAIEEGAITWASSLSLGDLARDLEPLTCVPIPRNLTLCHDVAYPMMRLPNLLDHGNVGRMDYAG